MKRAILPRTCIFKGSVFMQTWPHESYQQYVCAPLASQWRMNEKRLEVCQTAFLKSEKNKTFRFGFPNFFDIMMFDITKGNDPTPMLVMALTARRSATNIAGGLFLLAQLCASNKINGGKNHKAAISEGSSNPALLLFYGFSNMYLFNEITLLLHWRSGWKLTLHNMELSSITSSWDWRCQVDDHGWFECVRYLNVTATWR